MMGYANKATKSGKGQERQSERITPPRGSILFFDITNRKSKKRPSHRLTLKKSKRNRKGIPTAPVGMPFVVCGYIREICGYYRKERAGFTPPRRSADHL